MDFRSFKLAALLVSFLMVGDLVPRSIAQSQPLPKSSPASSAEPIQAVRARFFSRIREMLAEAKALEAAGKPGEAMLIGVRASRMLEVIGGERVWPRAQKDSASSPAEYLAVLAERYTPDVLKSARPSLPLPTKTLLKEPEVRSATPPAAPATAPPKSPITSPGPATQAQSTPGKPSPFDRFPQLPSKSRSWVPVGDAVAPTDDWTPVGGPQIKPSAGAGPPVSPTPIPVFEEPGRGKRFGEKSESGGVSDQQVGPIPVNLVSPGRPDSNAIDIRADEGATSDQPLEELPAPIASPLKLPGDVQSVPVPMEAPEKPVLQKSPSITAAVVESQAAPASGKLPPTDATDSHADSSSLWFATLIGGCGGVLLVLAGGFLVRRFTPPRNEDAVAESIEKRSVSPEAGHSDEGMTEAMIAASVLPEETTAAPAESSSAWKPGASWDGSAVSEREESAASAADAEQTVATQLQLYRGEVSSAEADDPGAASADDITPEEEANDTTNSESHSEPVVPFRVIGTEVVLGEAESARVDEELQQRREKILQRVLDENSDMQRRLDEQGEQPREAA